MKASSRSVGVMAGGVGGFLVGGPMGAFVGGSAGGAAMDIITTAVDSAVHGQKRPSGLLAAGEHLRNKIRKNENVSGDVFDLVSTIAFDGLLGQAGSKLAIKHNLIKNPKLSVAETRSAPAAETPSAAPRGRRSSIPDANPRPPSAPAGETPSAAPRGRRSSMPDANPRPPSAPAGETPSAAPRGRRSSMPDANPRPPSAPAAETPSAAPRGRRSLGPEPPRTPLIDPVTMEGAANAPAGNSGVTHAGQSYQSHCNRPAQAHLFPPARNAAQFNANAASLVSQILRAPDAVKVVWHHARYGFVLQVSSISHGLGFMWRVASLLDPSPLGLPVGFRALR